MHASRVIGEGQLDDRTPPG